MAEKRVTIIQTRSAIRRKQGQKDTLKCLGLGRIGRDVQHSLTPEIAGMLRKVGHLVSVKEADNNGQ